MKLEKNGIFIFCFTLMLTISWQPKGLAAERISLEDFLTQVKENNPGVKSALLSSEGGSLRSEEGKLLITPTAFVDVRFGSDAKLPQFSFVSWESMVSKSFSFGVAETTPYGLTAKLRYDIIQLNLNNLNAGSFASFPGFSYPTSYINASPVLEITQSLWSNGFGRSTQASLTQIEAQALSSSYGASYQAKATLVQAETSYWNLALARQILKMDLEAVERAQLIYQWNLKRARLQLADQSDALQSEALLKTRELDVMSARNTVRSASRAFNSVRFIDSDVVKEELVELTSSMMDQLKIPSRTAMRDDVKAAEQMAKASQAGAEMALERDLPTLDLTASLALNGQVGSAPFSDIGTSMSNSFGFSRPTAAVGLRFQVPLDFGLANRTRDGWRKEKIAAEKNYDQRLFSQEQDWKNLTESLAEAKARLELSRKLELIQESKLKAERERLNRGRTTTFQVLNFEQDYLMSQMSRIRDQASVLTIIAQMKLFGESL